MSALKLHWLLKRRSCGFRRRLREELVRTQKEVTKQKEHQWSVIEHLLDKDNDHNSSATDLQDVFRNNRVCTKLVWYGTESGYCGEIFMSMILRKCWSCFISVNMITDPCKHTFYVSHLIKNIKMRTPFLIRGTFNPPITHSSTLTLL